MGHWESYSVRLGGNNKNDYVLQRKAMECLGYEETDGIDEWDDDQLFEFVTRYTYTHPRLAQWSFGGYPVYIDEFLDTFIVLNLICGETVLGTGTECGADGYYNMKGQTIYDPKTMRFHAVSQNWQPGVYSIDYREPKPIIIPDGYSINEKSKQELIERSTSKGYTELTALILEKLQDDHVQAALQEMRGKANTPMTKDRWKPAWFEYGQVSEHEDDEW